MSVIQYSKECVRRMYSERTG